MHRLSARPMPASCLETRARTSIMPSCGGCFNSNINSTEYGTTKAVVLNRPQKGLEPADNIWTRARRPPVHDPRRKQMWQVPQIFHHSAPVCSWWLNSKYWLWGNVSHRCNLQIELSLNSQKGHRPELRGSWPKERHWLKVKEFLPQNGVLLDLKDSWPGNLCLRLHQLRTRKLYAK